MSSAEVAKAQDTIRRWRSDPVAFVRECFGVEPDAWQLDALAVLGGDPNPARKLCMKACTGPGKAQPVGMVIETPAGPRRWGDLAPGDTVFALDGSPTQVVEKTWRGVLPLYRVTFDDGTSTDCCADHLWRVRGRTERRHVKQRSAEGWNDRSERLAASQGHYRTPVDGWSVLSLADILARNDSNDGRTRRQFEVPAQGVAQFPEAEQLCDAYALGVWLGDGCKNTGRGSWQDEGIDAELRARGYSINRSSRVASVEGLSTQLRLLGVRHLGSHERYVPDAYLRASEQQRKDVLAGLLDTDGTIATDGCVSFDVTSRALADNVAWLARSLGGKAKAIRTKRGRYRGKDGGIVDCRLVYRVTISVPFCPFRLQRKMDRWTAPQARYLTRWIDKIEPIGEGEAMCIQVDHPLSCYLANDFIVTHNSAALAWIGWHRLACFASKGEHPKGAALSITASNLKDNLWAELSKWQSRSKFLSSAFTWTAEKIYANDHPETWFLSARSFAKDANAEAIGRALSGLHSKYPFILLDETGEMPIAIGKTAQQIFTGNPTDAAIVQAGNPTAIDGLLYDSCVKGAASWNVITITADPDDPKRTPRVSIEHAREMIAENGRDDPWVMATILGLFPPAGFRSLLGIEDVEAAMNRHYSPSDYEHAARILGVDVAREGDDKSVIFPRQGIAAFPPIVMRKVMTIEGAGAVARKITDWDTDAEFIDNTGGFGGGWIDQLQSLGHGPIGIHFAGKASDSRYFNKRSEMIFLMAEWIKKGGAIPRIPELIAELTTPQYSFRGDKLIVEPKEEVKKRLGRSPDLADALALTFAYPAIRKAATIPGFNDGRSRNQSCSDYDSMARWLG